MIREMTLDDVERVGTIWLAASLQAHHFVPSAFWLADHKVMVEEILPKAHGHVHVTGDVIDGFITVGNGHIGCLFVEPGSQRRGIGRSLLDHVKLTNARLELTVYEQNPDAIRFYDTHGFRVRGESTCPHTGCAEIRMEWAQAITPVSRL